MVERMRSTVSKLLLPLIITVSAVFSLSWNASSTQRTGEVTRTEVAAHFTSRQSVAFHQPASFIVCIDLSAGHFYQSLLYQRLIAIALDQQDNVTQVLARPFTFKVFKLPTSDDIQLA